MIRRVIARLLFQIGRTGSRVTRLAAYLAVGTLRLAEVKNGIRQAWQGFCQQDAQIAAGLMPWESELVERFVQPGAEVLVIGCGSGRDLLVLSQRGCHVTGVDPADESIRTARRMLADRRLPATLVEGFFEEAPLMNQVDVVVFSYYAYTYIPEAHRRILALRKAANLLKPGGHVLMSYPFNERPRRLLIGLGRMMGALTRSDWRLEAGDLIHDVGGTRPCYSYAHAFEPGEIQTETAAAGLRPVFQRDASDCRALAFARA
jgi:SAM-dependent methyltransferase